LLNLFFREPKDYPERALYMIGAIGEAKAKAKPDESDTDSKAEVPRDPSRSTGKFSSAMPPGTKHQSQSLAVVVLLGGPGSGKGTHGQALAEALGYQHLSSGEHIREHIRRGTPLGRRAREAVESGQLVSDEVALELVRAMLGAGSEASGLVMDGYPRSLAQAKALETIVSAVDYVVTQTLYLQISDDEMMRRLSGRLTCRACGRTCHETSKPPVQAGVCDACGGELFRRADDEASTIQVRIAMFHRMIDPLLEFYRASGRLAEVAAEGSVREVSARVIDAARRGPRTSGIC
jgi:adenylate kinase